MPYFAIGLALFTVSLSAVAQIVLKLGVSNSAFAGAVRSVDPYAMLIAGVTSPMILTGLFIYGIGAALWLVVLSHLDVTVAYPLVGVSFLITMLLGAVLLNEAVTPMRILGTVLVATGCILVGRTA